MGLLVAAILLFELLMVSATFVSAPGAILPAGAQQVSNAAAIGAVLYTKYVYYFELSGAVLLVAMIGAIVLTLRHKRTAKRQDVAVQVGRRRQDAIEVVHVETGKGIS
jgi:NADH-quinone oxidoreductase subunit J